MAGAKIANRMGRQGKPNPGRRHLAGADVTAKMQRQYEDILRSLRARREYTTDAKRKQVAAATVRKLAQNPDEQRAAERLAERFHGRAATGEFEVLEREHYDEHGAVLGYLVELDIVSDDWNSEIPVRFPYDPETPEDNILLVSDPQGRNLEFVGGDQDLDWRAIEGASEAEDKNLVLAGPVGTIVYYADKHHLAGPTQQKDGMEYYHEFGEEGGELPWLVFDRRNSKFLLVGGSYTIRSEGITN